MAYVMTGSIVIVAVVSLLFPEFKQSFPFILIMEVVMLNAFGISWLVKGETFWKDK